uniref:UBX domain-containing protein n=1 Tax=Steinernema glaseri TaxID=37863 RepID=A0A1I8AX84_9BILA
MDRLNVIQRNILAQFMELTNMADEEYAAAILASVDWTIEKAFDEFQAQQDDPYHHPPSAPLPQVTADFNEYNLGHSPSSGYSSRPSGSKVTLSSNGVDSGSGSASSLMVAAGDAPAARSTDVTEHRDGAAFEIASDDEPDDREYYEYDDDTEEVLRSINNPISRNRPSLIPLNWTSEEDATSNFAAVFEARYGGVHPFFHIGTLRSALREAFETPDIMERRPLAIYLHDDNSIACNIFAEKVVCSSIVSDLLNAQYVTWAWDVTLSENKEKLIEWLQELNMHAVLSRVQHTRTDNYPLVLSVVSSKSQTQLIDCAQGHEYINDVSDKLMLGLSKFVEIKNSDKKEESDRIEREQIRREQQEEYDKALAADRARVQEEEREKQILLEAEQEEQRKLSVKNSRCESAKNMLPPEPAATEKEVITFKVRFPGGNAKIRRFHKSDKLKSLIYFVESEGFFMEDYRIWDSSVPKRNITAFDSAHTFQHYEFPAREQVIVEEI